MMRLSLSKRLIENDDNFTLKFDYVMVFPMIKGPSSFTQSPEAKYYVKSMLDAGLYLFTYLSVQEDELIVLIQCPDDKLRIFTDLVDFPLRLDQDTLRETLLAGNPSKKIAPITITHDPSITKLNPYEFIYCKYEMEFPQALYHHYDGKIFPKFIKLKLINDILKAAKRKGGCDIPISTLIHKGKITGYYPLHNPAQVFNLHADQMDWRTPVWRQPFEQIRMYYGEKIALYNLFLGHYAEYLIAPAIIGFAFQLVVWVTLDFSHPVLPFFGVIICVGAILMLEGWKRKESIQALMWGMSDYEAREIDRPEFAGLEMKSYINGEEIIYFPPADFQVRLQASFALIGALISLACGVVAGIYYLRFSLQSSIGSNASTVASLLNTSQILVFNMIYQVIVQKLTNLENHRTDTSYQDSMIVKLFLFQFVNSYASFFFIAFIAQNLPKPTGVPSDYVGQCGATNCMLPLSINLAIIFGTRVTVTNIIAILEPYILQKLKFRRETKGVEDKPLTPAEKDYMLLPYDPMIDNISNYADIAIQFGFMVLFIVALPIGCFFALVNSYVKVRIDSYKMTYYYQRPIPDGAQDIGTWQDIFNLIAIASVITNGGLICFTMSVLHRHGWTQSGRLWIFIGFQWTLISLQFLLEYIIPDVPDEVEIQLARTEFINEKVILQVADEEFADFVLENDGESGENGVSSKREPELMKDVVEEANKPAPKTGCCRSLKGKRSRKIKNPESLTPIPESPYPFLKGSGWPSLLGHGVELPFANEGKKELFL